MSLMHLRAIRCQSNPPTVNKRIPGSAQGIPGSAQGRLRPSRYKDRVVTCGTEPYGQRHTNQHPISIN
ncbi:hypothetical protein COCOBI_03-4310 [Coccomyxa sp. Obi]|nr:hypothetical protein COCOBI_03-4310 [Coccomyxa sp. Obi]